MTTTNLIKAAKSAILAFYDADLKISHVQAGAYDRQVLDFLKAQSDPFEYLPDAYDYFTNYIENYDTDEFKEFIDFVINTNSLIWITKILFEHRLPESKAIDIMVHQAELDSSINLAFAAASFAVRRNKRIPELEDIVARQPLIAYVYVTEVCAIEDPNLPENLLDAYVRGLEIDTAAKQSSSTGVS